MPYYSQMLTFLYLFYQDYTTQLEKQVLLLHTMLRA